MRRLLGLFGATLMACATTPDPTPASAPASSPASAPAHGHAHGEGHGHHDDDMGHHGPGESHGHEGHAGHMKHRFDDPEYWAKQFDAPERDAWQRPTEVVSLMTISAGQTVADIGAGTGYFLPHLSTAVGPKGRVLGLDIEPKLVAYMTERAEKQGLGNVTAKTVAPDDPQLEAGSLDRILIVDTWHHIAERGAYAKKLFDGLRPGGALYVVDFTKDSPTGPPVKYRIPAEVIATTLKVAGFDAEVLQEGLPRQFVVKGTRPLQD